MGKSMFSYMVWGDENMYKGKRCLIFTPSSYLIPPPLPLPPGFIFFNHIPLSRASQPTTHAPYIFFPDMVFESCHNIRNQPVSTGIPSLNSFHDIITIRTHQYLGKILKDIFSRFIFKEVLHLDRHSTQGNIILFLLSIVLTHSN